MFSVALQINGLTSFHSSWECWGDIPFNLVKSYNSYKDNMEDQEYLDWSKKCDLLPLILDRYSLFQ